MSSSNKGAGVDSRLQNLTNALYLDGNDDVVVRTGFAGNIVISGNVNVPGDVTVNSTPDNPVHVHLTELGTFGNLTTFVPVRGNVTVDNFPAFPTNVSITQMPSISGNVSITQLPALGNISITQLPGIRGNVNVDNFPSNVRITDMPGITGNVHVYGNVSIDSLPEVEIKNDVGNPIPVEWVYGNGASLIPWEVQVARGKIPGVSGLNISGYNNNVGTTFVPLWYGNAAYVYPATASTMRIWSDSASDTNLQITVSGLDASYNLLTETITLTNGSTGVLTNGSFLRINTLSIVADPGNVGNIFCGNNGKTQYYCVIEAGAGRSQQTIYTVPNGYTFYLNQSNWYTNNTGNNVGLYRSWTQSPTAAVNIILTFPFPVNYNSRKTVPRPYPEKTDIQWQVSSKSGSCAVGGQIEGYLIANSVA